MNFVQMLMKAPDVPKPKRPYVKSVDRGIKSGRLRLYMEGEQHTARELAELMGKSIPGMYDALKRLEKDGLVERAGRRKANHTVNGGGMPSVLWTWRKQ